MEAAVKFAVKSDVNFLSEIISRRWVRKQLANWPNAEVQCAALQSLGVDVSYPTVRDWRNGQLPGNKHKIALISAGFKSLLDHAFEPAAMAGRLAELEANLEQEEAALRASKRELERIRAALAGEISGMEGG